jgi:hypothetical protein
MALTASMKAQAIVSSSQQIQNYNLFAVTSSANTFYGNQTINGDLNANIGGFSNYISLGGTSGLNTYGTINVPTGERMILNSYHGLELKTSGGIGSGTPISILKIDAGGKAEITGSVDITGALIGTSGAFNSSLSLTKNSNGGSAISITNTNAGSSALAEYTLNTNSSGFASLGKNSSARDGAGIIDPSDTFLYSEGGGNISIFNNFSSGQIRFAAGASTSAHVTIASTGDTTFSNSVTASNFKIASAGGGIDFSVNSNPAGMTSELLNDYEEGTWTPVIGGSTSESGQSYSGQTGYYTKIGRVVTTSFRVVLTNKGTITGDVVIKGLPFTAQNSIFYAGGTAYWTGLATSWNYVLLEVGANTTFAYLDGTKTAVVEVIKFASADISNSSQFNGSITYIV